ncbi:MAG: substrate-binding domain-containing protein [Oscillospiraceae bacterium]|nr:substrate-binding domain-containing protein [Oscillospiraceae bacterium]
MKPKLLIGVITNDCYFRYQSEILNGIIAQAFRCSCNIAVISPLNRFYIPSTKQKITEKEIFQLILSDKFNGFIYDRNIFIDPATQTQIDNICIKSGKPVMLIDANEHSHFETIPVDDRSSFEFLVDHLIDVHGLRKIYCITGPKKIFCSGERLKGYFDSMKKHKIPYNRSWYFYGDFWTSSVVEIAYDILNGNIEKPEAIVCGNDIMAKTLTDFLQHNGINVPEDIAVTGYDGFTNYYSGTTTISSFKRPNFQLGAEALRRLYRIITGKTSGPVANPPYGFIPGNSCGCKPSVDQNEYLSRQEKINNIYEDEMIFSDMLVNLSDCSSLRELFKCLNNYTSLIYSFNRICICLSEKYSCTLEGTYNGTLDLNPDDYVNIAFNKTITSLEDDHSNSFRAADILPYLSKDNKKPVVYYISLLHNNDDFYGYAAVSFGKLPISYSRVYMQWINNLSNALHCLKVKSVLENRISVMENSKYFDSVTGLLNMEGSKKEYPEFVQRNSDASQGYTFIYIEIDNIKNLCLYLQQDNLNDLFRAFADTLRNFRTNKNFLAAVLPGCFCLTSSGAKTADLIYNALKNIIQSSSVYSGKVSFTIGTYKTSEEHDNDNCDILHMIGFASENIIYTNRNDKKNETNYQAKKLYELRDKMRKMPEKSWNLQSIAESMYLSKSYLQKLYRLYFEKSIIEDLIYFRLQKAKKLLTETNKSINEISLECGYSAYTYFAKQFKSVENISPTQYREKYTKTTEDFST